MEGELVAGLVDLEGLAGRGDDLALLEVIVDERVEELVLDLGALGLLRVIGVDGDRVVDVEVKDVARRCCRTAAAAAGSSVVLAARRQSRERARSSGCPWRRYDGSWNDLPYSSSFIDGREPLARALPHAQTGSIAARA